jgi:hypothetical protein
VAPSRLPYTSLYMAEATVKIIDVAKASVATSVSLAAARCQTNTAASRMDAATASRPTYSHRTIRRGSSITWSVMSVDFGV